MPSAHDFLPGVHRAPNIQTDPGIYEIENRATDPQGLIEKAMRSIASWKDRIVVDMGAGTGFYISLFHEEAAHVYAVEPHDESRLMAMSRVADIGLQKASVLTGSAARTIFRDQSVGIYHSRFAYFWPPDCVPGIMELDRIMHPGGTAFVIDNDYEHGEFASWLARRVRKEPLSQDEKERFWASFGFQLRRIESEWLFQTREELEAVVRLEFGRKVGDSILERHRGLRVGYTYCLYHRSY
ncbi:MAG: class I SAM-dependent methyltransferase [Chlorobia bacterium]|nr:class I SAM-dependent methyltransferase [Fimbriimonadaceae bacterium]